MLELEKKVKKIEKSNLDRYSSVIDRINKIETALRRSKYDKNNSELREELAVAKREIAIKEAYIKGLLEGIALMKQ